MQNSLRLGPHGRARLHRRDDHSHSHARNVLPAANILHTASSCRGTTFGPPSRSRPDFDSVESHFCFMTPRASGKCKSSHVLNAPCQVSRDRPGCPPGRDRATARQWHCYPQGPCDNFGVGLWRARPRRTLLNLSFEQRCIHRPAKRTVPGEISNNSSRFRGSRI